MLRLKDQHCVSAARLNLLRMDAPRPIIYNDQKSLGGWRGAASRRGAVC